MLRPFRHSAERGVCWSVSIAAFLLLAITPSVLAAPKTTHAAAYEHMQKFMQKYDKDGFATKVDFGRLKTYRVRLAQCRFVVKPTLGALAQYGPETNVIYISKDPRKVKGAESEAWGETAWHEVTHALEDRHGDDFTSSDKLYQDRNTWYMTHVIRSALPVLDQLERRAKAGASVDQLKALWAKYLEEMEAARKLPETLKYPPDLALMRSWFGFRADSDEVKNLYLTGKAFSGKEWGNLRKALAAPAFKPADWAGVWSGYWMPYGNLTLTVSGSSVTGVWEYASKNDHFEGTLSADATRMTGTWLQDTDLWAGPEHRVISFDVTLGIVPATGEYVFDGYQWSGDGSGGRTQFQGCRE